MSPHPTRSDRSPVEDLLGDSRLRRAEQAALSDLLAPVIAPAHSRELRGEAAALAAFRAAFPSATTSVAVHRRCSVRARVARALSIKAAVAALTVAGLGGVAVAGTTGSLPGPIDAPWHKPAEVQPERSMPPGLPVEPVQSATPAVEPGVGESSSVGGAAVAPPGRTVAARTRGAERREAVQERNAQRRQEQREELAADREARKARQAEQRARQAEKKRQLTGRQTAGAQPGRADRAADPSRELPAPQNGRSADRTGR